MARTSKSRSSSNSSGHSSNSSGSSRSSKGGSNARSGGRSQKASSQDESLSSMSFARARHFVEANTNLQTAGIALAGAGILALVSTQAGRDLIKTASNAIANLVSQNFGSWMGQESDHGSEQAETGRSMSSQRESARI